MLEKIHSIVVEQNDDEPTKSREELLMQFDLREALECLEKAAVYLQENPAIIINCWRKSRLLSPEEPYSESSMEPEMEELSGQIHSLSTSASHPFS